MVRIQCFHCCGLGSIPGQGTEIPQVVQRGQKKIKKKKKVKIVKFILKKKLQLSKRRESWAGLHFSKVPTTFHPLATQYTHIPLLSTYKLVFA